MHITEISFKFLLSLHPPVLYATNLIRVKAFPSFAVKPSEEIHDEDAIDEVYEGVAHVTLILKIDWEVEEIILPFLFSVKTL